MKESHNLPLQTRLAKVSSVDIEARTAELIWATGAQVRRMDWWTGQRYIEELSMEQQHVDMGRMNSGNAPLLNSHSNYDLSDVIGVVENASVDGKEGRAKVRFSKREAVDEIFRDVQDGILRNVSVGYAVRKYEVTERDVELPIYRAVEWEPMELSLVPIGADPGAQVRSEESKETRSYPCEFINAASVADQSKRGQAMTQEAKGTADPVVSVEDVTRKAVEAERARVAEINTIARLGKRAVQPDDVKQWIDGGTSVEAVRKIIIDRLADEDEKTPTRNVLVETIQDETVMRREAMALALQHRYRPSRDLRDDARQYRGMTLMDLARECVEQTGTRTRGMDKMEVVKRAFGSTSDFPFLLESVASKSLRAGYENSPRSFTTWARATSLPDFKQVSRVNLGDAPSFEQVNEGGEFKRGVPKEARERYALVTYGKVVPISRQAIVNDDMDGFTRLPELMGRAAADLESDTVYSVVTTNAALADGIALFHASHNNLTGTGTAISVASLGVGRSLMRSQKNLELRPINIAPAYLIVPAALETIANQYTSADFVSAKSSDINPFKGVLEVVVEPRLDANSLTAWYLSCAPAQCDTVEYAYLDGNEGVYLETRMGFDVDGMEIKGRLDFGAKAIDFRGLYKNNGA